MFIQNRAKSIAQKLNAKNIAPLNRRIYDLRDKIAESRLDSATLRINIDDVISVEMVDSAKSQNLNENNPRVSANLESYLDSANPSPLNLLNSFRKKGCTPRPAPPTRQKAAAFSLLGGEPRFSASSKKSAGGTTTPFDSDFLHHEAGEFSGASHEFNSDSANSAFLSDLKALLLDLKPWRKGPFNICGIEVQSEWDSAIKFNIIAPHLSVEGKVIADIGCNNGYYAFRLLPLRPSKIVGFEPSAHCKAQFDLIDSFIQSEIRFEVLGVEDLADYDCKFDCILCLGVIYHRTNPIDCLKILRGALNPRGELIIDTLIIESQNEIVLSPLSYAKMKNVYFIPSISAFKNWLVRAGFREIELLCVKKTTSTEQRKTAWSGGESLEDFLDKDDKNKTIEGYSAPIRAYFKAKI